MPQNFALSEKRPADDPDAEPLDTFELGGWKLNPSDKKPYEFELYEPPDSAKLMSLQLAGRMHPSASMQTKFNAMAGVIDYLGACMKPDQYEILYRLLTSPMERGMDIEPLMKLCEWVLETTTDLPTSPSTGSARGSSNGGRKSTGGSSRKAPAKRATTRRVNS